MDTFGYYIAWGHYVILPITLFVLTKRVIEKLFEKFGFTYVPCKASVESRHDYHWDKHNFYGFLCGPPDSTNPFDAQIRVNVGDGEYVESPPNAVAVVLSAYGFRLGRDDEHPMNFRPLRDSVAFSKAHLRFSMLTSRIQVAHFVLDGHKYLAGATLYFDDLYDSQEHYDAFDVELADRFERLIEEDAEFYALLAAQLGTFNDLEFDDSELNVKYAVEHDTMQYIFAENPLSRRVELFLFDADNMDFARTTTSSGTDLVYDPSLDIVETGTSKLLFVSDTFIVVFRKSGGGVEKRVYNFATKRFDVAEPAVVVQCRVPDEELEEDEVVAPDGSEDEEDFVMIPRYEDLVEATF
ncbi:unnamed protein product [Caenorhabditis sp. 36 PRJEB53466]|nr:unnamed protein product [Caenorhabditis sp. 36 PRJEB53466]